MANRKISDLTALTTPASGDYLPIVDISEAAEADKNKRITIEELMRGAPDGTAAAPGIAFEGDPDTGIYSPDADQVALATGGTGRLFVDENGRVGVGTTNVSYNLEVAGTSPVIASNGSSNSQVIAIDSKRQFSGLRMSGDVARLETTFFSGAGGGYTPLTFWTSDTERARIDSSGRLLVGTSSDSGGALLQINDDRIRVGTAKTPASATDTGTAGEICWDANYVYVCTATNTWKRSALSTW